LSNEGDVSFVERRKQTDEGGDVRELVALMLNFLLLWSIYRRRGVYLNIRHDS
jgi:hypothetical protein